MGDLGHFLRGEVGVDASELAVASGDVWTEMRLAASLGEVAQRRGQREEAERLWRRALTFYEQRQEHRRRMLLSFKLSEALANDRLYGELQRVLLEATLALLEDGRLVLASADPPEEAS